MFLNLSGNHDVPLSMKLELERVLILKLTFWYKIMTTLCSARDVLRLRATSTSLARLPIDLIHRIAHTLPRN